MSESRSREPGKRKPNYLYAIVSVALVLFLLGFFGLLMLHAQQLIILFKEKVNILVEFTETVRPDQIDSLKTELSNSAFLKPGSLEYIDKTTASQLMQEDFGEDFLKLGLPNPFFDMLSFNVQANYMESDSLARIRTALREKPFISDVFYQENLIDEVARNVRRLGYIGLGIGIFFLLVAVTLIHNTIRLALYANRFLIKNMQLVGASWNFISRPYLLRSIAHGFISGVLALAGLVALLYWVRNDIPEINLLQDTSLLLLLFLGLLALGMTINAFSTYYVVNKYLKMRVDDLY